jgi:hypothetical protein
LPGATGSNGKDSSSHDNVSSSTKDHFASEADAKEGRR